MDKKIMNNREVKGIVKPMLSICPYCGEELSMIMLLKRKMKKVCKCGKCGKKIDERHVIY